MSKKPPAGAPWAPAPYSQADIIAVQAVFTGKPQPHEQERALRWLVAASGLYDMSFHPEHARWGDFAEGKRHVGNQLLKALKLNPLALKDTNGRPADRDPGRHPGTELKS